MKFKTRTQQCLFNNVRLSLLSWLAPSPQLTLHSLDPSPNRCRTTSTVAPSWYLLLPPHLGLTYTFGSIILITPTPLFLTNAVPIALGLTIALVDLLGKGKGKNGREAID